MLNKTVLFRSLLLAVVVLCAVLLIRTGAQSGPPVPQHHSIEPRDLPQINLEAAAQRLSEAIAHPTVADPDFQPDQGQTLDAFDALHKTLSDHFPRSHQQLEVTRINQYALLMTWPGSSDGPGLLLAAHQDVVPADDPSQWDHPPFAGTIEDGHLYGRGALDDKSAMMAQLEAVESLLESGLQPQRTIHLAFGFDEEIGGRLGAQAIARTLTERGVTLDMVVDEGGAIMTGKVPGLTGPAAMIGIAEKGYTSVDLTVHSSPGHSSIPPEQTAIEILAAAITRIKAAPFAASLNTATRQTLEHAAPHLPFGYRLIMRNLWLTEPLLRSLMNRQATSAALLKTTVATTIIEAGQIENVLPATAHAVINLRLLPGHSSTAALAHLIEAVDDERVVITVRGAAREASPISPADSPAFERLRELVLASRPEQDLVVLPYLMMGGTDARHYSALTDHIYRIVPYQLSDSALASIHGHNERIDLSEYQRLIGFYQRLILSF